MADEGRISVTVLGTGIMGAAMARNLAAAGNDVRAWNRTRARAEPLADAGVTVADTPAQATDGADAVLTMLTDAAAVEAALDGERGALAALGAGGLVLQMSTVGVEGARQIGSLVEGTGALYVDAPVLGTRAPAEEGKLVVLASGPADARERSTPVFDAVGQRTMWVGEAGTGTRLKLVAQNWVMTVIEGLAETIALARALDVDPALFLEAIEGGPLGPAYAQIKGKMMIDGEFPPSFTLAGARKDVQLVLDAARSVDLELALAPAILERFERAIELGHGDADMAACIAATPAPATI